MSYLLRLAQRVERLGLPIPRSLVLFVCVGLTGLVVHTGVFSLLFRSRVFNYSEAWLSALTVATLVTWSLNRRFTFANTGRHSGWEIVRYAVVTVVAQSVSFGVSRGLVAILPHWAPEIAVISGAVAATAFSYTGQRFFTFAPARKVAPIAIADTPVLVAAPARDRSN